MGALYSEIPQFVTHDYIDLDKITYITKFRSGSGHDYSDDYESCRNMKHYFQPNVTDWSSVNIYSPVDGTIIDLEDSNGIRVTIQSSAYPAYKFIIFHVDILPHITKGYSVAPANRSRESHQQLDKFRHRGPNLYNRWLRTKETTCFIF